MSWLSRFRAWVHARRGTDSHSERICGEQRVVADDSGIAVHRKDGSTTRVAWDGIDEIRAWKQDLLTTDELLLAFSSSEVNGIVVSEEHPGYRELIAALSQRFPSIEERLTALLLPPFARNETVLFERRR